ncbi:radical SAM protein [Stygiolobus caldivivus]|uniref:Radical SAM protein n=1 Tax=Stygiolobus caldivivus TaxID=2824673 RepID=A0A8D5ZDG6_9CREN|nr:radical SAM protein [Stygiolobus caldivivus]BCU69103.1 radical SAM protein [Stygiolobus caldivivus]
MVLGFMTMKKFAVLSLTGGTCSLNCFYCSSKYISSMEGAINPEELYKYVKKRYETGTRGFLISGGFNKKGELEVRPYIPVLKDLKREYGDSIVFNIHPGLLDKQTIEELRDAVDIVDFEFAYSPKAFQSKGLTGRTREDYVKTLELLIDYGPRYIVPHIMLGLPNDNVEESIRVASSFKPYLLNFLVLIPTKGTPSQFLSTPSTPEIIKLIQQGSELMQGKVSLGCMRPHKTKEELDKEVIRRGLVERIANPSPKVLKEFALPLYDACCSLPSEYLDNFKIK